MRVTNGLTGTDQRTRDVSSLVRLPNNGLVQLRTCGGRPLLSGVLTATRNLVGTPPAVTLTWPASIDEATGETDVTQYNIYRKLLADPLFGSALFTIPAGAPPPYVTVDASVQAGIDYVYAVAAQDCSPSESSLLVSATVRPQ